MHNVALCVFYNERKEILLQDRRKMSKVGEEWGFFGGHIEEGESPEIAVVREIHEELGYFLKSPVFVGRVVSALPDGELIDHHVYAVRIHDIAGLHQSEGAGMQFFSIAAAQKLKMVPGDELVLDMMEKYLATKAGS